MSATVPLGSGFDKALPRKLARKSPDAMMTNYVDVFVAPVPESNIGAYRKQAELFAKVWREHGTLSCIEVEADDVKPGTWTSFPQSVELKPGEKVFVGIITYGSRAHRDEVNAKAMKDERMAAIKPETMRSTANACSSEGSSRSLADDGQSTLPPQKWSQVSFPETIPRGNGDGR